MSKTKRSTAPMTDGLTFDRLVLSIRGIDAELAAQGGRAVNISLTLRNWLIGRHIEEYERLGKDRAQYGEKLMNRLADELAQQGVTRCDRRELYLYRVFYLACPKIVETLPPQFKSIVTAARESSRAADRSGDPAIGESATPQSVISAKELIAKLSFSHIAEFVAIDDTLKRSFYETECIRGNWSVRELKRQIASLYFERSGLSRDKAKLARLAHASAETAEARLTIHDPYIIELLGLKPKEVMSESHLEDQLLDKLQEFLFKLGHGFCFEAHQKRILIGDSHGVGIWEQLHNADLFSLEFEGIRYEAGRNSFFLSAKTWISAHARREKSIRHGQISAIHVLGAAAAGSLSRGHLRSALAQPDRPDLPHEFSRCRFATDHRVR